MELKLQPRKSFATATDYWNDPAFQAESRRRIDKGDLGEEYLIAFNKMMYERKQQGG